MFTVRNLTYSYTGGGEALRGLSATMHPGVTLLVGPNAGGKTTLLRMLAGLLVPESGKIAESAAGEEAPRDLDAAGLRRLARMVMQDADPQILGSHVGEDVMLGQAASALGDGFPDAARALADRLGLGPAWNAPVEALSYGQKRKLCLMHALLAGPRALLLDEPFAGLDFPASRELRQFLRDNRDRGLCQVVSTHELEPVFDLADWVVVVVDGRAAIEGRPDELASRLPEWSVRPPGGSWE